MKCLDTYALMAIAQGDTAYAKLFAEEFIIPDTTLAEFYWVLLRDFSQRVASEWAEKLRSHAVAVTGQVMLAAMDFRHRQRKRNLSFFDAVGYIVADSQECPFVTGDEGFRGMEGVEFVKSSARH